MNRVLLFPAALGSLLLAQAAQATGNPDQGKILYQANCGACHSVDYNGVGPAHKGVFGRHVAGAKGFNYSPALKTSDIVWTADNLDKWLSNPEMLIPGQRMGFSLSDASQRADVIEYLKSLSPRE
jgi:cytochrome c